MCFTAVCFQTPDTVDFQYPPKYPQLRLYLVCFIDCMVADNDTPKLRHVHLSSPCVLHISKYATSAP